MIDASFSVVTYHSPIEDLEKLRSSIARCNFKYAFTVVDNGSSAAIRSYCAEHGIRYVDPGQNLGFGAAHNLVLKEFLGKSRFHIPINPDVYFEENTFEPLLEFMRQQKDVGLCVPKVLYPDGRVQHLCKLVPSPADLLARRFLPAAVAKWAGTSTEDYEMRKFDYHRNLEVPILSGCCMVLKDEALQGCGLFDERFFLYLEDVDLSRRVYRHYRNVHFARSFIYHHYQKSSYQKLSSLKLHLASAIRYFNKWGWLNDKERQQMNERAQLANGKKGLD